MRKQLMFASLALASGLALAQTGAVPPPVSPPDLPANPQSPARPAPTTPSTLEPQASGQLSVDTATRFGTLDADADGSLSRNEVNADMTLRKDFKAFDNDRNGTLNQQEYEMAIKAGRK